MRTLHELLQPLHRFDAGRYQTFAIALADHAHHALIEIDLIVLQAHEFGDPQARAYSTSSMVRSRCPKGSDTVGASSSESTSASVSDLGRDRPIFGIAIWAVGSSSIKPSRIMKRKKRRKLDSCRAVDRGLDPPSTLAAMNPSISIRVALSNALSRSSNQRASAVRSARYAARVFADSPRSSHTASRNRCKAGSAASRN